MDKIPNGRIVPVILLYNNIMKNYGTKLKRMKVVRATH